MAKDRIALRQFLGSIALAILIFTLFILFFPFVHFLKMILDSIRLHEHFEFADWVGWFSYLFFLVVIAGIVALVVWHSWFGSLKKAAEYSRLVFPLFIWIALQDIGLFILKALDPNKFHSSPLDLLVFFGPVLLAIPAYKGLKKFFAKFELS